MSAMLCEEWGSWSPSHAPPQINLRFFYTVRKISVYGRYAAMCRWMFVYKSPNRVDRVDRVVGTRHRRSRRTKTRRRRVCTAATTTPTYSSLCYDNNGLFNQALGSRSKELPDNTDGFGVAALIGNEWEDYRSMIIPDHDPNIRSWLRAAEAEKPRLFVGHLRANNVKGLRSGVTHTHPYIIHGKHKSVMVVMNGYIDGYTGTRKNTTDTQILAKQICKRVNGNNESLDTSINTILQNIHTDFRMTLCVVVTEPEKPPKHYVGRCMNWDTTPPTLYHSPRAGVYASETLYSGGDWKIVPATRI